MAITLAKILVVDDDPAEFNPTLFIQQNYQVEVPKMVRLLLPNNLTQTW